MQGEFEAASIIIRPSIYVPAITVDATDLTGADGAVISTSAIDVRVVKCWYQAGTKLNMHKGTAALMPEALLKDDTLVKVDVTTKMNYLRVHLNGVINTLI